MNEKRGVIVERLFKTHEIRKQEELNGLWEFYPVGCEHEKRKVLVPSCFETYPGLENYRGTGIYECNVYMAGNIRISLKGVSHTAKVYIDDNLVGEHYNAYTPFTILLKDMQPGSHKLKISADNSCHKDSALHIINDYYNYGGISRPVFVEEVGDVFIENICFTPFCKNSEWYGTVSVEINNLKEDREIILKLYLDEKIACEIPLMVKSGITLWEKELYFPDVCAYDLDKVQLYTLKAILKAGENAVDDLIDRVGFREITIEKDKILWNGKPLVIKGYNRHEDHALFGNAIPPQAMDVDIRLILESGANAVRTSHYPNDERFLDLCDENGILVWEEAHARGLSEEQMRHPNFRRQSLDCIDEMIHNHYNHPCIFTWGILNECASETQYGREVYAEQYEEMRRLDKSRPLTSATCKHFSDICLDLPDIVSVNIYPQWYEDVPVEECLMKEYEWIQTTGGAGKPVIVSEIGAGGIPGYHSDNRQKWSEERQADILREQLSAIKNHPEYQGVFIWQFSDIRVPDENFYGRPRAMNNKGIFDEYRKKKLAFQIVKKIFSEK